MFFPPQWTPAVCGECPRGARQPTEIMGSPGVPADTRAKNYSQSLPTDQVHNKEKRLARSDKKIENSLCSGLIFQAIKFPILTKMVKLLSYFF